jgi:pyruvate dehydrogenase E1 component alpha subunit
MKKEQQLDLYYQMVLIRRLEERGAELYQAGRIGGFMHLYIGQEAVSTGLIAAREPRDRVITAYRDHGVALNCGISANEVMAELLGKATGVSKGKGDQYAGNDNVTICMFGDGATNIGYFHEALNLAKTWGLRVLWVCENNIYGMGTAVERASAVSEIRQKAEGYGMKNSRVDGMDVTKVYDAAKEAIEFVRKNSEPYLLEIMTYRYRGHSMGDPERYRKAEEVKKWQENDPIGIFNRQLIEKKISTRKALDEIEARVEEEVAKAVEFAEASPEPAMVDLFKDIYADN